MSVYYKHPTSGKKFKLAGALSWLWVLLFGPIWCIVKGMWGYGIAALILALCTFGVSHLIFPFFTYKMVRRHYDLKGWTEVDASGNPLEGAAEQ